VKDGDWDVKDMEGRVKNRGGRVKDSQKSVKGLEGVGNEGFKTPKPHKGGFEQPPHLNPLQRRGLEQQRQRNEDFLFIN
jgi:hypothetical protein